MKKTAIAIYLLAAVICITAVLFSAPVNNGVTVAPVNEEKVINLSDNSSAYTANKALEKRFLNIYSSIKKKNNHLNKTFMY